MDVFGDGDRIGLDQRDRRACAWRSRRPISSPCLSSARCPSAAGSDSCRRRCRAGPPRGSWRSWSRTATCRGPARRPRASGRVNCVKPPRRPPARPPARRPATAALAGVCAAGRAEASAEGSVPRVAVRRRRAALGQPQPGHRTRRRRRLPAIKRACACMTSTPSRLAISIWKSRPFARRLRRGVAGRSERDGVLVLVELLEVDARALS